MIMVTAVFALALAYYSTRFMVRWGRSGVMPAAFAASAALLVADGAFRSSRPAPPRPVVYLHFGGMGALLHLGLLVVPERAARSAEREASTRPDHRGGDARRDGRGTRGRPVGADPSCRGDASVLAIVQLVCAWGMIRLGSVGAGGSGAVGPWAILAADPVPPATDPAPRHADPSWTPPPKPSARSGPDLHPLHPPARGPRRRHHHGRRSGRPRDEEPRHGRDSGRRRAASSSSRPSTRACRCSRSCCRRS